MKNWNKIWESQDSVMTNLLLKYLLPFLGIGFLFMMFSPVFKNLNYYSTSSLITGFIWYLFLAFALFIFPSAGLEPKIKIYKEGVWLKPLCLINIFGIKFKLFGKEKWIEWEEIENFKIMAKVNLGGEPFLFINIVIKNVDKKLAVVLNIRNSKGLKDVIILAGQENKLV